jgi:DNA-binding MarR family transcriptional regulator
MKSSPTATDKNERPAAFVDNYLLYQLAATSHLYSTEFHSCVKSHGLKIHVWRVLGCLIDQQGLMLTELAKLVLYEQSRLTKIIDQMVSDGLVTKKTVATDRRKTSISITPKGRKIVEPLLIQAKEHERKILRILSKAEKDNLKYLLQKLTLHINSA